MILDTQFRLKKNPDYTFYLRNNSYWYKFLNRYPERFDEFEKEFKNYNRKLKNEKISKTLEYLEMLSTIMSSLK